MQRGSRAVAAALALLVPTIAAAQGGQCHVPDNVPTPRLERVNPADVRRTPVTRYLLALTWTPTRCAQRDGGDDAFQCGTQPRFGFVVHGLWPETRGRDWPQYCRPVALLRRATLRRNMCMTPSAQLLQHEWTRHGSCMARDADAYFARGQALYAALRFPDMAALARRRGVTVGTFTAAFAAANRGMRPTMLSVQTDRGSGALTELRICLDARQRWTNCPAVERGAAGDAPLAIPPR